MFEEYTQSRMQKTISFRIAHANRNHLDDIIDISLEREHHAPDTLRTALESYLDCADAHLFIALSGATVAGFAKSRRFEGAEYSHPGWYLSGVIVRPHYRGAGIGKALTATRLERLQPICTQVYYFVNARNRVSIQMHDAFGFVKVTDDFVFPGAEFEGGKGHLYALCF